MAEQRDVGSTGQSNPPGKLVYAAPRLTVYGDLRKLTLGKGGNKGDGGGNPVTKS